MPKGKRTAPSRRRMRVLKAEFWTDPDMADLSFRCRLTFAGLICAYVDDHGRELDDLRLIKAAIWLHDDNVTVEDIAEDMVALNVAGKIVRYDDTTSGQRGIRRAPAREHFDSRRRYVALINWKKHQRVDKQKPSQYPPPPAPSRSPREQSRLFPEDGAPGLGLGVGVGEGSGLGVGGGARGGGDTTAETNGRVAHEPQPLSGEARAAIARALANVGRSL